MLEAALAAAGLAGSGAGAAVAVPLLGPFEARTVRVRTQGGLLLGLAVFAGLISARVLGFVPQGAASDHAVNMAGLLTAPLAVLHVTGDERGGWRRWLWVPAGLYALVALALALLATGTRVPFAAILPVVLGFTAAAIAGRRPVPAEASEPADVLPPGGVIGFLVVLNAAQIVRWLGRDSPGVRGLIPLVVTAGVVAVVWRFAQRLSGLAAPASLPPCAPSYDRSGLDAEGERALLDAALLALDADRRFADPGLSLRDLAAAVATTPHRLSQALNHHGGRSFAELLCQRRVEDAKAQLAQPANDRFTIEALGQAAGFKSRSAFYSSFRRLAGMAPAEFRRRSRATRDEDPSR